MRKVLTEDNEEEKIGATNVYTETQQLIRCCF